MTENFEVKSCIPFEDERYTAFSNNQTSSKITAFKKTENGPAVRAIIKRKKNNFGVHSSQLIYLPFLPPVDAQNVRLELLNATGPAKPL